LDLFSSLVTFPFILAIGGGLPEEGLLVLDLSGEDSGTGGKVDFDIDTSDEI